MTRARSEKYDLESTTLYHCMSRCVRRAFLCGKDPYTKKCFEHRKDWVEERLFMLVHLFAIELYAFAIMSNHLHVVIRINVKLALEWSDDEVIERYQKLFKNAEPILKRTHGPARDELIAKWRSRLHDISWFMRLLNEDIARQANREDEVTGRFWEGRFKCVPLLDDEALLGCMAYVDLNHIRAGITNELSTDVHSSIARRLTQSGAPKGLVPFEDQASAEAQVSPHIHRPPMKFSDYVEVLSWTAAIATKNAESEANEVSGNDETPPQALAAAGIDSTAWIEMMEPNALHTISVLGAPEELAKFAAKHGRSWVRGKSLKTK